MYLTMEVILYHLKSTSIVAGTFSVMYVDFTNFIKWFVIMHHTIQLDTDI
uniref:Uncharacterized protein n=1 Tax=Anguilla anguilla TaxID=7936 RepID=A0A0E9WVN9_ANGAN